MQENYYWSDSFDETFYVKLAQAGFISTSMYDMQNKCILLPEIQFDYAVLHFDNLHISKKVRSLLHKNEFTFKSDESFEAVMDAINDYHDISWISPEYKQMLLNIHSQNHENFKLRSFELYDNDDLIAGEIGYQIGKTYTSLTGFFKREKKYNNWGKLQLVLLAQYLQENAYDFWNLGHASLQYKVDLGANILMRDDFLKIWKKSTNM